MAKSNVTQFAEELKLPVALLLEQLLDAGVKKKAGDDAITEQDKTRLLDYVREMHGNKEEKKRITLTRKQTTEIKKADATGKARTIQIEVRKKRTFVKVDKPTEPVVEPEKPVVPPAPIINAEEARKREAEAKRQAELKAQSRPRRAPGGRRPDADQTRGGRGREEEGRGARARAGPRRGGGGSRGAEEKARGAQEKRGARHRGRSPGAGRSEGRGRQSGRQGRSRSRPRGPE